MKRLLAILTMFGLLTLAPALLAAGPPALHAAPSASLAAPAALPSAIPAAVTEVAPPPERHPHIRAALNELRQAKNELEHADHDFGGHRAEAVGAVDNAIRQLELALQFDKR